MILNDHIPVLNSLHYSGFPLHTGTVEWHEATTLTLKFSHGFSGQAVAKWLDHSKEMLDPQGCVAGNHIDGLCNQNSVVFCVRFMQIADSSSDMLGRSLMKMCMYDETSCVRCNLSLHGRSNFLA